MEDKELAETIKGWADTNPDKFEKLMEDYAEFRTSRTNRKQKFDYLAWTETKTSGTSVTKRRIKDMLDFDDYVKHYTAPGPKQMTAQQARDQWEKELQDRSVYREEETVIDKRKTNQDLLPSRVDQATDFGG